MDSSGRGRVCKQRFTHEFVDRDHEPSNRRDPKRERGRRQELLRQRHKRGRRALICALVEQPPQKHGQMDEVQEPARGLQPAALSVRRSLRRPLPRTRCCTRRRENAVPAAKMPSSGSPTRTGVSARSATRCGSRTSRLVFRANDETVAPFSGRHVRGPPRVLR